MSKKSLNKSVTKSLVILRGIPGSGKTTLSHELTKNVCSADDYFTHGNDYIWSPDKVGSAHMWCQRKCRRFMLVGADLIVIANTSTTAKEMKPYYDLAEANGYKVFSLIVENRLLTKNVHNVPDDTLKKMKDRFEISL